MPGRFKSFALWPASDMILSGLSSGSINSTPLLSSSSSISLSAQPPNIPLGEESTGVKACGRKRRKNKREGKSDTFCTSGCLTPVLSFATSVVGVGSDRKEALARCTVVNFKSMIVYDKFITPTEKITGNAIAFKGEKQVER